MKAINICAFVAKKIKNESKKYDTNSINSWNDLFRFSILSI